MNRHTLAVIAAAVATMPSRAATALVEEQLTRGARPARTVPISYAWMSSRITPSRHRTADRRRDQRDARRVRMARKQRRGWA